MSRPALLDTSYLIDLERETAAGKVGPARKFLSSLRGRPLVISIVTVEELLEGAVDEAAALASLQRFAIQGLQLAQARRCALLSVGRRNVLARTTRGSSPLPNRSMQMSSAQTVPRSNDWVDATCAFDRRGTRFIEVH